MVNYGLACDQNHYGRLICIRCGSPHGYTNEFYCTAPTQSGACRGLLIMVWADQTPAGIDAVDMEVKRLREDSEARQTLARSKFRRVSYGGIVYSASDEVVSGV